MTLSSSTLHDPWVHRGFRRDKLRVRERYWRPFEDADRTRTDQGLMLVIPDGVVWRKYLPFLVQLVKDDKGENLQFALLESAVELMDCRNSSPCVVVDDNTMVAESAAMQERNRVRKLVQEYPDTVVPFCDLSVREEEYDEWNLLQYAEMSIQERSRHALLRAGRMLLTDRGNVTLLVDKVDGVESEFRDEDGIQKFDVNQFAKHLVESELQSADKEQTLLEAITRCEQAYKRRNSPTKDPLGSTGSIAYLSEELVEEGLRNGELSRGRIEVTKENPREGYVTANGQTYFVNQNLGHFNRTLHHDVVVIQPLPESDWGRPMGRRRLVHHQPDESEDTGGLDDNANSEAPPVPSARVVAIHAPSRRRYVATLVEQPTENESAFLVIPMNIRIPKIRFRSRGWQKYKNQRLLVQVEGWDEGSNYPSGHCVRVIGEAGDLETEISCILLEHEIELEPFSANAMACLPSEGSEWSIPQEEIQSRRDLRHSHRIFSVDPPGCQDIDDTMHARILANGDVEVGVHIADVTYFVPHNSALDREAQVRGTTFYLVDRRFDMLPSLLSSDLCSLHGNTDRLAVSVIWTLSPDLETVKSCWYGRTIIHNIQAMTYEQAHNILHGKPPDHPNKAPPPPLTAGAPVDRNNIGDLKQDLSILTRLARKLRKDREDTGGAVDLSSGDLGSELKFVLDENGHPTKVAAKKELEIHHTIAEMMILANRYVAQTIYKSYPDSSLLRVHQTVEENRFSDLRIALEAGGVAFDGTSNMALAKSLNTARKQANGVQEVNALWQSLATRAMSEAKYVCTGGETTISLTHYGLGIDQYTHFTSPIRRYADVVVHKQLLASLEVRNEKPATSPDDETSTARTYLHAVPDSNVLSVLGGEFTSTDRKSKQHGEAGNDANLEGDDLLDSLIDGASELALGPTTRDAPRTATGQDSSDVEGMDLSTVPYKTSEVTKICDGLNNQNRSAKLSSFDCQRLFLSLYFRDNIVNTQAVVTGLRANGLLVYVPMFDLKGPVFLSDMDGNVQMDPAMFGLPRDSGLPATVGFASAPNSRRFPSGACILEQSPEGELLRVNVSESHNACVFRTLDVITVQLSCDLTDTRARVPAPRLHLLSVGCQKSPSGHVGSESTKVKSNMISPQSKPESKSISGVPGSLDHACPTTNDGAISKVLSTIKIRPLLHGVPLRFQNQRPDSTGKTPIRNIGGRIVVGGFENPDTRAAAQEAAITAAAEAAAQRRAVAAYNPRENDYLMNQSIERDVTTRMHRLAAQKRNARISKSK